MSGHSFPIWAAVGMSMLMGTSLCDAQITETEHQDAKWWNERHQWDGVTPWSAYIKPYPGFLGPNALPIPAVKDGGTSDNTTLESATEFHRMRNNGDNTQNLYFHFYTPLVKQFIGAEVYMRPVEHFKVSEEIRDERISRTRSGEGYSTGDLYCAINVRLMRNKLSKTEISLETAFKTTTGKNLKNARHTNAPGYFFDINAGRNLLSQASGILRNFRISAMSGLYVWQAGLDNQDDAFLYGVRADLLFSGWMLSASAAGYIGWVGIRDKPMALRMEATLNRPKADWFLAYQAGMLDNGYQSLKIGSRIKWVRTAVKQVVTTAPLPAN